MSLKNIFPFIRLAAGTLLAVSGSEKLFSHYQNFLYVIQSYQLFPSSLEYAAAVILPWVEFLIGLFLLLGLWLPVMLRLAGMLFLAFMIIVSQALIRGLPIDECGCFGELIFFPLWGVLLMDSVFLILIALSIKNIDSAATFSLDHYFSVHKSVK